MRAFSLEDDASVAANRAGNSSVVNSQGPGHRQPVERIMRHRATTDAKRTALTDDVGAELQIVFLCSDLVFWRHHYPTKISATTADQPPTVDTFRQRDSRIVNKDMQLTLFPENACVESLEVKDKNRDIREELFRRLTDCRKVREIKL